LKSILFRPPVLARLFLSCVATLTISGAFAQALTEKANGLHIEHQASDGTTNGIIVPTELREQTDRYKISLRERGFVESDDSDPPAIYALARIKERKAMAILKGRPNDPATQGFYDLRLGEKVDGNTMALTPTLLDEGYFSSRSERYVMIGQPAVMQLYTDTEFGTLWIQEEPAGTVIVEGMPDNVKIGVDSGKMMDIKYREGAWSTVVGLVVDDRYIEVEAIKKLNKSERVRFLELVGNLAAKYRVTK